MAAKATDQGEKSISGLRNGMKNIFFRLCFLMLLTNETVAQNNVPPPYEFGSDTGVYVTLDEAYWQILGDKEEKWSPEQVRQSPVSDDFHVQDGNAGVDYAIHVFWFRYRLKNAMTKPVDVVLLNSTQADKTEFFLVDEANEVIHYTTGFLHPNKEKDGLKKINGVPIQIEPGKELTVYNRIENNYFFNKPKHFSVSIGFAKQVIQREYINGEVGVSRRDYEALFVGILFFACIFNLFFYSIVRDRVYLYYALFLFYFSFDTNLLTGIVFPNHPSILYTTETLVWASGIFLFVQFMRNFLKTFNKFPLWDKALQVIAFAHPIAAVARLIIEPYVTGSWSGLLPWISQFLFIVGLFMILITFLKSARSSSKFSRVLLVSAIPSSIFWSFGFGLEFLFETLKERFGVEPPRFIVWLNEWSHALNLSFVIWFVISFSWVLLLQFLQLRKENTQQALDKERLAREAEIERSRLIELQKIELEKTVEERTQELKVSLENLKSTQSQLIHSEKMASLGELTAGIAHEIQNPLNFVNNFSDLNKELLHEMKEEIEKGNLNDATTIANNVIENEEKINQHGKRADGIVKGMLQHSYSGTGVKESGNINNLTDEYIRLAYHGFRAKNKSFHATVEMDFDETIGNINIVPQDIGKVILNLISNAFYAVHEKKQQNENGYEPTVSVSTKKSGDRIEVRVVDNGNGIPKKVIDKIFQPFFTTKPTGQGTGLGLSIAYDIVKAHGGQLNVVSKEGQGTEFIISLL